MPQRWGWPSWHRIPAPAAKKTNKPKYGGATSWVTSAPPPTAHVPEKKKTANLGRRGRARREEYVFEVPEQVGLFRDVVMDLKMLSLPI